jgi:hypothetical protein
MFSCGRWNRFFISSFGLPKFLFCISFIQWGTYWLKCNVMVIISWGRNRQLRLSLHSNQNSFCEKFFSGCSCSHKPTLSFPCQCLIEVIFVDFLSPFTVKKWWFWNLGMEFYHKMLTDWKHLSKIWIYLAVIINEAFGLTRVAI